MKKLFWIKICLLTAVLLSCTANLRYEVQAAGPEMNIYAMYLGHADRGDSVLVESKGEYLLIAATLLESSVLERQEAIISIFSS